MKALSVIVPVYNCELYIEKCMESILCQTFKDFEVIAVDDGSVDNSGRICDDYAKKDDRIKVIHKQNGGASSARNVGLKAVTGKYVLFIDSDDYYINNNCFEELIGLMDDDTDVLWFRSCNIYPSGLIERAGTDYNLSINNETCEKQLQIFISSNNFIAGPCNKMIKSDFIKKNDLYFIEGIRTEDVEFCMRLLVSCAKHKVVNNFYYGYRQNREGSVTNTIGEKSISDYLYIIKQGLALLEKCDKNTYAALGNYLAYHLCIVIGLDSYYIKKNYKEIRNYKFLLKFHDTKKVKYCYLLNRLLGFKFLYLTLGRVIKRKKKAK